MTKFKEHINLKSSVSSLLTSRFSHHPERYFEILRIMRKCELHHIASELGANHWHEDEDHALTIYDDHHKEEHAIGLASALEELGPCFIKLGQILSTRPDLLPAHYIHALSASRIR